MKLSQNPLWDSNRCRCDSFSYRKYKNLLPGCLLKQDWKFRLWGWTHLWSMMYDMEQ